MKTYAINASSLEAAGYKSYPAASNIYDILAATRDPTKKATQHWQRAIQDRSGKNLYFLNVYLWDLGELGEVPGVECRLYRHRTDRLSQCFNLDLLLEEETTVAEAEEFYRDSYTRLGCVPDLHNN